MVKTKSSSSNGDKNQRIGKSLINSRFSHKFINTDGMQKNLYHQQEVLVSKNSITQQNDLSAFLLDAILAAKSFATQDIITNSTPTTINSIIDNVIDTPINSVIDTTVNSVIDTTEPNSTNTLLNSDEIKLMIPKRPEWSAETTKQTLLANENTAFLLWRKQLAHIEEEQSILLTPYEKNIEIWRQLWRVVERSDLTIQLIDARNPHAFISTDLISYTSNSNLLLINKSDLLSLDQRRVWAAYFHSISQKFAFFSAKLAREKLDFFASDSLVDQFGQSTPSHDNNSDTTPEHDDDNSNTIPSTTSDLEILQNTIKSDPDLEGKKNNTVKNDGSEILDAGELLELLESITPWSDYSKKHGKRTVGFVGYPNVGKSSTLNALVGATKVRISTTPGKTKHFQTIHLPSLILCDCPGLVFPSFATTKAEMVCNGILPIDQLQDYRPPIDLICTRIPKFYLESVYGLVISTPDIEGRPIYRPPTSEELLKAYALARGFRKSSQGNADEARAARYILKDYVNGKLLFVHPPSGDYIAFNQDVYSDPILLSRMKLHLNNDKLAIPIGDLEFFEGLEVKARVNGRHCGREFFRVGGGGVGIGGCVDSTALNAITKGDKKHKKDARKKIHVHWTK